MIEKGRRKGLDKEERTCPLCAGDKVDDEHHFIFECPTFIIPRNELLGKVGISFPNFHNLSPTEKLKIVLDQEDFQVQVCIFIKNCTLQSLNRHYQ